MRFAAKIAKEVAGFETEWGKVAVDSIESFPFPDGERVRIDFHLEGPEATTTQFTYAFCSDRSVRENLEDLAEFLREHRNVAARPPYAVHPAVG